jgi:hypothetical protein
VHGLLKASFISPKPQRDALARHAAAWVVNRVQKVLKNANIKLASVATDMLGVSGRRMFALLTFGSNNYLQTFASACDL